jgi:ribosomal protein S18 acetylase RimI-like enzyme
MDLDLVKKLETLHLNGSIYLYMSRKESYNNYDLYFSDFIDDYYWNFAANIQSLNIKTFKQDWQEIKNIFEKNNRQPALYISPTSCLYNDRESLGLKPLFNDSWLILKDLANYPQYKSDLDLSIEIVDNSNIEDFIEAVSNGFASDDPNDPYHGLTEGYRIALRNSIGDKKGKYQITHILVKYNKEVVGTLTINYDDESSCLYNITTKKDYKRKGICKELMSYVVNYLHKKNIKIVCLQTEVGFYTEQVYLRLGFEKLFEGYGYGEE